MSKKAWSIVLLCLIAICFVLTILICINTGIAAYNFEYTEIDPTDDLLPGASILQVMAVSFSIWIAFSVCGFMVASVGFILSVINQRIAQNPIIKRISTVFLSFYSVILILIIGISTYSLVA